MYICSHRPYSHITKVPLWMHWKLTIKIIIIMTFKVYKGLLIFIFISTINNNFIIVLMVAGCHGVCAHFVWNCITLKYLFFTLPIILAHFIHICSISCCLIKFLIWSQFEQGGRDQYGHHMLCMFRKCQLFAFYMVWINSIFHGVLLQCMFIMMAVEYY